MTDCTIEDGKCSLNNLLAESGVNEWNKVRSTDDDLLGEISVNSEEDDSE
jgi:hypothetical protein